jgi:hypothetical protein
MGVTEEAGKVAASAIESFRSTPGLLYLTLVNVAFLLFVYFIGTLVLAAYREQQQQIHERYQHAIGLVDACLSGRQGERLPRPGGGGG